MRKKLEVRSRFLCGLLTAVLASVAQAQELNAFQRFAVQRANEHGFKQCDRAVAKAFDVAAGDDMRVGTHFFDETRSDALLLTAVFGRVNDTIHLQVQVRHRAGRCYVNQTGTTLYARSCAAYLAEYRSWQIEAETLGVIFAKNPGGVTLTLTPASTGCISTIHRSSID